jgi:hypothetical protein
MSITINQGDYVLYQDISVGNPTSRSWNFPGGTPTGSVSLNPIIRYLSPSGSGFNAKLTVTKVAVTSTKEESNIIVVLPENISVSLSTSVTTSPVHMGTTVIYTVAGSTGNLSYYSWNIAGLAGFTGTSQTQSSTLYSWINLTGSELGAAYSTYTSTSSVVFNSVLGNTSSSSTNVTYSKNGGFEPYNYLTGTYTLGVSYYNVIDTGIPLGSFGMAGSGNAYLVDTNYASTLAINNTQFRAQGESTTYWSSSQDIEFLPTLSGGFFGQYIASQSAFQALGVTPTGWESLSRYTQGNYMIPGDLGDYFFSVFYFADTAGYGKNLINNRYWTSSQVESLIFNEISIGYQSSRALEISPGIPPVAYFVGLDGINPSGFNPGGACLPSSQFVGIDSIEIYLRLRFSNVGSIATIDPIMDVTVPVIISSGGSPGNSQDGNLVLMQDTLFGTGLGVATLINDALTTAGYDSNVVASASPDYSWESDSGSYSISDFNGLKIAIIDRGPGPFLVAVDLSDNGPWNPYPYLAFPSTPGVINWTAFNTNRVANPYQTRDINSPEPVRGWFFGNP